MGVMIDGAFGAVGVDSTLGVCSVPEAGVTSLIQLRKNTLNILLVLICMVNLSFNVIICGQFKNSASSGVNTSPFFFKLATANSRSTELSGSAVKAASAWAINLVVDPR